jgi:hypothetical protein
MQTYTHKSGAQAAHTSEGETHAAFVKALHVFLCKDTGGWFAQGLEIDYAASGADLEEAKQNFATGLALTINEHLKMHGNLNKILVDASPEVLSEYNKTPPDEIQELSFLTAFTMFETAKVDNPAEKAKAFPFKGIHFTERVGAAA